MNRREQSNVAGGVFLVIAGGVGSGGAAIFAAIMTAPVFSPIVLGVLATAAVVTGGVGVVSTFNKASNASASKGPQESMVKVETSTAPTPRVP